jgi:hypothetical protein
MTMRFKAKGEATFVESLEVEFEADSEEEAWEIASELFNAGECNVVGQDPDGVCVDSVEEI